MKQVVPLAIIVFCMGSIWSATCPQAQIDAGCILCDDADSTLCTHCGADRFLATSTCEKCPVGKTKGPDDIAYPNLPPTPCYNDCEEGCQECITFRQEQNSVVYWSKECKNCKAGRYLTVRYPKCYPCSAGRGKPADTLGSLPPVLDGNQDNLIGCPTVCTPASNCGSCGADPAVCLTCPSGTYMSSTNVCLSCHISCSSCSDPTATSCKGCSQNYYWIGGGACAACPAGTGKAPHAPGAILTNPESPTICYKIYNYSSGSSSGAVLKLSLIWLALTSVGLLN